MGTRGAMGVRIDGQDKIQYVHFDSYPSGWPSNMVAELRRGVQPDAVRAVVMWTGGHKPTEEEQDRLAPFTDLTVSGSSRSDPYCLLRNTQGCLRSTLKAGVILDSRASLDDSVFCEYAYIANFDDNLFEVYRGFQKERHDKGRYATVAPTAGDYYPVALVATFPLDDIPKDWVELAFPEENE